MPKYTITNGTNGDDEIQGGRRAEVIHGLDGNDTIHGGNTDLHADGDTMYGDGGDDLIAFSSAPNELGFGGDGVDTFYWSTAGFSRTADSDSIGDFEPGVDHIWLGWVTAAGGSVSITQTGATSWEVSAVTPGMYDFLVNVEVIGSAPLTMADLV